MEDKRPFFESLSVVKEVCQAFGLPNNKILKFTEAFKSAITSVPPAAAVLNPTPYQPDKAGLRNYIIIYQEVLVTNVQEMSNRW